MSGVRMRRRRPLGVFTVAVVALTACGVRTDATPRAIPEDDQVLSVAGAASGTDASGAGRIYLVAPGEPRLLRSVPRDTLTRQDLMSVLLLGPNENELSEQFSSSIPLSVELLSTRSDGTVLFVDISEDINELSGQGLLEALAQIVYTASELDDVQAVQITVAGEPVAWPTADGASTTDPLQTYDYPGIVRTAQPAYPATPSGV